MPVSSGEALLFRCGLAIFLALSAIVGCGPDDNPMGIGVSLDPSDVIQASAPAGGGGGGGGVGAPTVTSVAPEVGTTTGMNTVVVSGSNFSASTTVTFGTLAGTVTFVNANTLNVVVPQNPTPSDATVVVANGTSQAATRPTYTYVRAPVAYATLFDAVGTFSGGGRIRTGNFNGDTNLDVAFIEGGNQVSIATGNGSGLLTEQAFGTVVPLNPAGNQISGLAVGLVNGSSAIGLAEQLAPSEIRVLFKTGGTEIDTETRNTVTNQAEDLVLDPDNPRVYVTKIPSLLERYTIDATGTMATPLSVTGITGGNLGELALGTRENINVIVVTDSTTSQVRLVRLSDQNVTSFGTLLTGSSRAAATMGEDSIMAAANPSNGTVHVITEDAGNTVTPLPLNAGGTISGLAVGDVNGDALPDVVVTQDLATNGQILAFLNGGFQGARLRFSAPTMVGSRTFSNPRELVFGQFNGDLQLDIVLFTDGLGTRLRVLVSP